MALINSILGDGTVVSDEFIMNFGNRIYISHCLKNQIKIAKDIIIIL